MLVEGDGAVIFLQLVEDVGGELLVGAIVAEGSGLGAELIEEFGGDGAQLGGLGGVAFAEAEQGEAGGDQREDALRFVLRQRACGGERGGEDLLGHRELALVESDEALAKDCERFFGVR